MLAEKLEKVIAEAKAFLKPQEVDIVVYHDPCQDGAWSAWNAWKQLGDSATYVPMNYPESFPAEVDIKGKNILVVDFSFGIDELTTLRQQAKKVLILDHHKSAFDKLKDETGCFFHLDYSGAVISYNYFNDPASVLPKAIEYAQDADLFRWKLADSQAYSAAINDEIQALPKHKFNFRELNQYDDELNFDLLISHGRTLLIKEKAEIEGLAKEAKFGKVKQGEHELSFAAVETNKFAIYSKLGEFLCKEHKVNLALIYCTQGEQYKYSIRSTDGTNVIEIAKAFNGGGHPAAAGFTCSEYPPKGFKINGEPAPESQDVQQDQNERNNDKKARNRL